MNSNQKRTSVRDILRVVRYMTAEVRLSQHAIADTRPWERSEIADRFMPLRRKVPLTQRELGRHIRADRKTINRIEKLRTMPGPRTWKRFEEFETRHNEHGRIALPENWREELAADLACRQLREPRR